VNEQMTSTCAGKQLFFQTFGYVVFPQLFTPNEVEHYAQALRRVVRHLGGGANTNGAGSQYMESFIEQDPDVFYPLLDDDRLLNVVDGLLGADSLYTGNAGGLVAGARAWHTDVAGILHTYSTMKTVFYCDPVSKGEGCLSIIATSHIPEYSRDLNQATRDGALDIHSPDLPGRVDIGSAPGDVIAVDQRLWKSSWGGASEGCRMFALDWAAYPQPGWEEIFLGGYRYYRRDILNKQVFTDRLLATAGPRRKQKIAKMYDIIADAERDTGYRFE
jgi:hypothetical protein